MDSTLNDFLNEINEIAPLKNTKIDCEWKECFDSKSGFPYYWNTKTDEVTWEEPKGYIPSKSSKSNPAGKPAPAVFPELLKKVKDSIKIYKIAPESKAPPLTVQKLSGPSKPPPKKIPPRKFRNQSDSDDEKITLISSYGSESESECENEHNTESHELKIIASTNPSKSDDEDDDILSTVRKRAEELKMIGQADLRNIPQKIEEIVTLPTPSKIKPPIPAFSLVAGYDSNSENEEEKEDLKPEAPKVNQKIADPKTYSHSTLFPIVKPPDVNDFIEEKKEEEIDIPQKAAVENPFDTKIFQRKRRLGVTFVPTQRNNLNPTSSIVDGERKGLGFGNNSTENYNSSKSFYTNFKSGGVEFVKNDTLKDDQKEDDNDDSVDMEQIEKVYEILHEKLSFLCEGNKDVMPVQIILIQIETLFGALEAKSLKPSYLYDWLEGTSEDLIKLEKEAAPEGWLLQWDRSQKRYYYHNVSTGEGQWEYPQPDVVRQEEAMDISTTPPPPEVEETQPLVEEHESAPPPPPIRSPSPPPPPIISRPDKPAMPEPPTAPLISTRESTDYEPLPPGVDYTETVEFKSKTMSQENNDIDSAFDTFYSEIAAIESTSNTPPPPVFVEQIEKTDAIQESSLAEPPKKKKKKVKMGQGLSMKKKDVSKLVEKWKNVQKNF